MIIVKLIGGLGNQMFQYAAGRALAKKYNTTLKLDLSGYEQQINMTPRAYELQIFNTQAKIANWLEIRLHQPLMGRPEPKWLRSLTDKIFTPQPRWDEGETDYNESFNEIKNGTLIEGYFQSEKYFKNISEEIRSDFSLSAQTEPLSEEYLNEIKNGNTVSLHVRRGDYLSRPDAAAYHGALDLDYYKEAIKVISEKIKQPHFVVFSDDLEWCRETLPLPADTIFVAGQKAYQDLLLMSHCQNHIIANSSFSWWGAWLNPNPNKIVIGPRHWFKGRRFNIDDRLPAEWLKI